MEYIFSFLLFCFFLLGVIFLIVGKKISFSFGCFFLCFVSFVFALSGLSFAKDKNSPTQASDVLFVLDVSQSMDAQDVTTLSGTVSRLEAAKLVIQQFVEYFPNNTYGLQIFTGESTQVIPFTSDTSSFLVFLQDIHRGSLSSGGNALFPTSQIAVEKMQGENRLGAVIVLSDFEFPNTDFGEVQKIFEKKFFYKRENISVVGVGIGQTKGEKILLGVDMRGNPLYKMHNKSPVITRYDEKIHKLFLSTFQATNFHVYSEKHIEKFPKYLKKIPEYTSIISDKNTTLFWIFTVISYSFFVLFLILSYYQKKKGYFSSLKNSLGK